MNTFVRCTIIIPTPRWGAAVRVIGAATGTCSRLVFGLLGLAQTPAFASQVAILIGCARGRDDKEESEGEDLLAEEHSVITRHGFNRSMPLGLFVKLRANTKSLGDAMRTLFPRLWRVSQPAHD